MMVLMLQSIAGHDHNYMVGSTPDVSEAIAKDLIKGGFAKPVDKAAPVGEDVATLKKQLTQARSDLSASAESNDKLRAQLAAFTAEKADAALKEQVTTLTAERDGLAAEKTKLAEDLKAAQDALAAATKKPGK